MEFIVLSLFLGMFVFAIILLILLWSYLYRKHLEFINNHTVSKGTIIGVYRQLTSKPEPYKLDNKVIVIIPEFGDEQIVTMTTACDEHKKGDEVYVAYYQKPVLGLDVIEAYLSEGPEFTPSMFWSNIIILAMIGMFLFFSIGIFFKLR